MFTLEVYEGEDAWRWRLRAANGEIVCPPEAFDSRGNAIRSADMMMALFEPGLVQLVVYHPARPADDGETFTA